MVREQAQKANPHAINYRNGKAGWWRDSNNACLLHVQGIEIFALGVELFSHFYGMKKNLGELLTVALISTLAGIFVVYFRAYSWKKDDFDFIELSKMHKVYGNVLMLACILVNSFALMIYRVRNYKLKEKTLHWLVQALVLTIFVVVFTALLDRLMYYADSSIPQQYASTLLFMVQDRLIPDDGFDFPHLSSSTFFVQHTGFNIVMILFGNAIGAVTAKLMVSRKSFS